ncbi:MAG: fumarylacetoacetate hydrolase family protein [Oscillospiraceae bacterium]|jgi:2-keto-4-pentenoate hydratase/2-oxohepta-3-ene-1,7-dioic acid hydratase in catechol pathway|nr:fumarylacetoacetate hydrolase family protein [Oscillospiraceae bacterium]
MKFIRYADGPRTGWALVEGPLARPLTQAPWLGVRPEGHLLPLDSLRLLAPAEPTKIVAVGKNYRDHALEMNEGIPENPILFLKPTTALNDPDGVIRRPRLSNRVDYEAELAFVIGKTARRVKPEAAWDYIFGYTCLNDVTARDIQKGDGQWTRGKGFDGFAPVGPWLVTDIDPSNLAVTARLNGQVKQASRTAQFMWPIPELLAFITACMTLLPGDLVTTGTPAGIGPMKPGDVIEVEVENIGILRNTVSEEYP